MDHIPGYELPYQDETGAIDEGIADYFAAAINDDSRFTLFGTSQTL